MLEDAILATQQQKSAAEQVAVAMAQISASVEIVRDDGMTSRTADAFAEIGRTLHEALVAHDVRANEKTLQEAQQARVEYEAYAAASRAARMGGEAIPAIA
jgi:hypothetical protein